MSEATNKQKKLANEIMDAIEAAEDVSILEVVGLLETIKSVFLEEVGKQIKK